MGLRAWPILLVAIGSMLHGVEAKTAQNFGEPSIVYGSEYIGGTVNNKSTEGERFYFSRVEIRTEFDSIHKVAWSYDGKFFAVIGVIKKGGSYGENTHGIAVFDARTKKLIKLFPIKKSGVAFGDVAFSPDGKYLAGGTGVITLWDVKSWSVVRDIEGPYSRGKASGGVDGLAFGRDSKSIAVIYESVVFPESLPEGKDLERFLQTNKGNQNIPVSWLQAIMVFDVEKDIRTLLIVQPERTSELGVMFAKKVSYSDDGKYLITSRTELRKPTKDDKRVERSFVEFRNPKTGEIKKEIKDVHVMGVTALSVSSDGKYIATGTSTTDRYSMRDETNNGWVYVDNRDPVKLWNATTGELAAQLGPIGGGVVALNFLRNSDFVVSCQADIQNKATISVWDVAKAGLVKSIETPNSGSEIYSCAVSPEGGSIVAPVLNVIHYIDFIRKASK